MAGGKTTVRVLQCVGCMDRAGIETMLMNYYRNIDRNKIQFDFLVNKNKDGDYDDEIKEMGGRIYKTPGLSPLKWHKYQKYMDELFLEENEYKIIHCQNETMGFPALYSAKKNKIKNRLSHSHSTRIDFGIKWPIKVVYKSLIPKVATSLLACGEGAGRFLYGGKEVKIVKNAIEVDRFAYNKSTRERIRKQLKINNKIVIGHVGRFEHPKNHVFLVKMFYQYQKEHQNSILLLIGDGELMGKIKKKILKLGISDKVLMVGKVANVNDYYQAMDVFVMPSLYEGVPVVGIEAQSAGLKCLFSNNVPKEIDVTGNNQFLSLDDEEKWVNEISKVVNRKREDYSEIMKENGYDIRIEANKLTDFYLSLLEKEEAI